jgi:hypothetical protein
MTPRAREAPHERIDRFASLLSFGMLAFGLLSFELLRAFGAGSMR